MYSLFSVEKEIGTNITLFSSVLKKEKNPASLNAKAIKQQETQALITNPIAFMASTLPKGTKVLFFFFFFLF